MKNKNILLLSTGGTIASVPGKHGLSPETKGQMLVECLPEDLKKEHVKVTYEDILCIDSSNMHAKEWITIAEKILKIQNEYDAVIITHGTDTMAYTASMLSYLLVGCHIPVILTGAQKPLGVRGTDALKNIQDAFRVAYTAKDPMVMVVFYGRIILGNHSCKVNATSYDAFHSVYSEYIGRIEKKKVIWNEALLEKILQNEVPVQHMGISNQVILVKLYPGISGEIFSWINDKEYRGIVLESFGCGGIPSMYGDVLNKIGELVHDGKVVAVKTQCYYGNTNMDIYEVGKRALMQGAVCISNMTTEALVTKLMWALDFCSGEQAVRLLKKDVCGELTHVRRSR